jgi:hypothetical protein
VAWYKVIAKEVTSIAWRDVQRAAHELAGEVNTELADGWEPQGGVASIQARTGVYLIQAWPGADERPSRVKTMPRFVVALSIVLAVSAGCGGFHEERPAGAPADSYTPTRFTVVIEGSQGVIDGAAVTERFFETEGVRPLLGRFFAEPDYSSDSQGTAVLSHTFWVERLGSAPGVIGSTISVDGRRRVIIGIGPPTFRPDRGGSVWIPKPS